LDLIGLLIQIIVAIIIVAPVLWLVGRALAGKQNAKFTDAIWIVVLGIVIGAVLGWLIGGLIASIIMFFVWLGLIKHFFDCGWLKAFVIALVAVVVFVVIAFILALIGIGIGIGLGALSF
jgi:chromate transport protein ChrA